MLDELSQALVEAKGGDALAPVTLVAPSHYAAVAARRGLTLARRGAAHPGIANVAFTTVDGLVQLLGAPELARQGLRRASAAVEREALRLVAAEAEGPWPALAAHHGTLTALDRAFAELRRAAVADIETLAAQRTRPGDVARLLLALRRRLHDHGFADVLDLRSAARHVAGSGALSADPPAATGIGPLLLVEPPPMAPTEAELVQLLSTRLGCHRMTAPSEARADEIRACADPAEEARAAVRVVVAGLESGIPLWRHALLHPPGSSYARLLHQELEAAGIAAGGPAARPLDRSLAARALLGLLSLSGGDLPRDAVLSWIASTPLTTGPGERPVAASRWDALSADAGVVRGLGQWQVRLGRLAARREADRAEAEALLDFVEDLAARSRPPAGSWTDWSRWAAGLLDHFLGRDDTTRLPEEQRMALDQVRQAVTGLAALDAVSGRPDLDTFGQAVRVELGRRSLDTGHLGPGDVGGGVFVGPVALGRGIRFDTVVVVGMADAVMPGTSEDDAMLPDEARRRDATGALRPLAQRRDELLGDVTAALAAGEGRRVVTDPRVEPRSGRAQAPSRWLERLADADTAHKPLDSFAASLRLREPALDGAELALRALDHALRRGEDVAGTGPVRQDPRLATGIEAVRARASRSFTRFDGLTGPGSVSPFDAAHPASATRLETYAECPRRFLFDRVLGIQERTLPEDLWRIEARDRGSLVHEVLERYVRARLDGAPRSLELLLSIGEELLDEAAAGGLVGKDLLWRLDRAAILRDLHIVHAEEARLEPLAAEFAFGTDEGDAAPAVAVELGPGRTVRFRGRADRVDRAPDGGLVVSDYKTGRQLGLAKLATDPLVGGRRLQLPLYAMAARDHFGAPGPVRARYWMVSAERAVPSYQLELTTAVEAHFRLVVGRIAEAVEAGGFPGIPGPPRDGGFDGCTWCDFDRVCPATRDRQWAGKRGAPELGALAWLIDTEVPDDLVRAVAATAAVTAAGDDEAAGLEPEEPG